MRTSLLISTIATVSAIAGAGAPSASAASTDVSSASSANWAGYVVGTDGNADSQFSSVSGSWTEPSPNCSNGQGYAAFWVGLGGAGQQSESVGTADESEALEQVGTEADCTGGGTADQFAWYELVPSAPVRLDLPIAPGDHISAQVTVSGTNVTVALSDSTTGGSVTKTLQMGNPDVSSAEWIAEAPSSCDGSGNCQPLPLDDFGSLGFSDASATAEGHTGTISDPDWTAQPVELGGGSYGGGFASDGSEGGAAPSGLSSDGSSFSVSWLSSAAEESGVGAATDGTSGSAGGYPGAGYGYGSGYGGYGYGSGTGGGSGYGGYGYGSGYGGYGTGGGYGGGSGYGGYAGGYGAY